MKKAIKDRKSQEEMVGFVLIIVLVAVIVLVFLAISIRKNTKVEESRDVENFMHSSLLFTSSCKPRQGEVYDLRDLIVACYNNEKCLSGEEACKILNSTFIGLIENSFQIGEEAKYKAYELKVYKENKNILYLSKGNFSVNKLGPRVPVPVSPGEDINLDIKLYY
jgi:hypothetical protein